MLSFNVIHWSCFPTVNVSFCLHSCEGIWSTVLYRVGAGFSIVCIFLFGRWISKGKCSDSINWFGFLNQGHSILRSIRFFQRCRVRVIVATVNFLFPLLYIFLYAPINFDLWDQSSLIALSFWLISKSCMYTNDSALGNQENQLYCYLVTVYSTQDN